MNFYEKPETNDPLGKIGCPVESSQHLTDYIKNGISL